MTTERALLVAAVLLSCSLPYALSSWRVGPEIDDAVALPDFALATYDLEDRLRFADALDDCSGWYCAGLVSTYPSSSQIRLEVAEGLSRIAALFSSSELSESALAGDMEGALQVSVW